MLERQKKKKDALHLKHTCKAIHKVQTDCIWTSTVRPETVSRKKKKKKTSQRLGRSSSPTNEISSILDNNNVKLPKGLWKLSEVCCCKCHLPLTGIFIFSNHSQTLPLELITFTWSSQLSWGFPPESQKSSAYPSACLTQTCVYVCLHIPTPWLQPGLLCYQGTSFAAFSPRILFSLPYFPILKLTPISLSLLCSQYFKQVIHAEEEPK